MLKAKIFAVAGDPVLHSMSPVMFNAAFKAKAIDAVYTRIAATKAEEIIKSAKEAGIAGINITSPFKEEIVRFLDYVEEGAEKIGAVNTVVVKKRKYTGYNTDFAGILNTFLAANVGLSGKKAAVIGTGGAAKAAIFALLSEGAEVLILNRTFERAKELADILGCSAFRLDEIDEELKNIDILISCLPVNNLLVKPYLLKRSAVILDANYSTESHLVKAARERGCKVIDGREWLLFQGAWAFKYFVGVEPPLFIMRRALYTNKPVHKRNIAIVGFMGTGKSKVANSLSKKTAIPFLDTDNEIEKKAGLSIREIFETKGEQAFRRMERKEIRRIPSYTKAVISCGGGVVLSKKNIEILKKNCIVVWLWAGIDTILKRVSKDGTRPLLLGGHRKRDIKRMLKARLPLYACCSDILVRSDSTKLKDIVRKIYGEAGKFLKD